MKKALFIILVIMILAGCNLAMTNDEAIQVLDVMKPIFEDSPAYDVIYTIIQPETVSIL